MCLSKYISNISTNMYRNLRHFEKLISDFPTDFLQTEKHDLEIRLPRASKAYEAPSALGSRFLSTANGPV